MTGISRPERLTPCPICVAWTCTRCSHRKNGVDGRVLQQCPKCGHREGTTVPVSHYDREAHEAHVDCHRLEDSVEPVDITRMIHNATLVEILRPLINKYEHYRRLSLAIATGSREWNRCVNLGNQQLLKIESTVRSWTTQHPGGRP
jgi:hypothetical protein